MTINYNKSNQYFLILPFIVLVILRLFGFDGMTGQDAYAYVNYVSEIKNWFLNGTHPGYFFWPPGYSLLGALFSFTILSAPWSLQLISCLSLSGTLIYIGKLLRTLYPQSLQQNLFFYLIIFGVFAPYFFRNSMVTTSDMLACFFVSVGCYFGYLYTIKYAWKDLALVTLAIAYGTIVRYPVAVVLLPIVVYMIYVWFISGRRYTHLFVLLIPTGIWIVYGLFKPDVSGFLNHDSISSWSIRNYVSNSFSSRDGTTHHLLPNIFFIFFPVVHPGFMLPGLLFLYQFIANKIKWTGFFGLLLLGYFGYTLFLAGYHDQNPRHLLIVYPIVLIGCFYGCTAFFQKYIPKKYASYVVSFILMVQVLFCAYAFKATFKRNALEQHIADRVMEIAKRNDTTLVYSFDMDIALASRAPTLKVLGLYCEPYKSFIKGSLVLFNETQARKQWRGMNPMINWERINQNYLLTKIEEYRDHWTLYKIE